MHLTAEYIMSLEKGEQLDSLVTGILDEIEVEEDTARPWSTDQMAAIALYEIIGDFNQVSLSISSESPPLINHAVLIGDSDEADVIVCLDNWPEALCKALLLHCNSHTGEFVNPAWERRMNEAPKRIYRVK